MVRSPAPNGEPAQPTPEQSPDVMATTLKVIAWSLLLALGSEALLVILSIGLHAPDDATSFLVDGAQKVSWSVVVCVGVAVGTTLSRANAPISALVALLVAPFASLLSRSVAEAVHALATTSPSVGGPSPWLIALIRALEYVCLAVAVSQLGRRERRSAWSHALVGLIVGLLFGVVILTLSVPVPRGLTSPNLSRWVVNELLFPAGCALILFVTSSDDRTEPTPVEPGDVDSDNGETRVPSPEAPVNHQIGIGNEQATQ